MSYLSFLIIFVIVPSLVLWVFSKYRILSAVESRRFNWHWKGTGILALIAFIWTTPWDNYIVAKGVWSYGPERVLAVFGYVPLEEYLFFICMPLFNSALFGVLGLKAFSIASTWRDDQRTGRFVAFGLGTCIFLLGVILRSHESFTYFSAILLWFVPPLVLQWVFDPQALIRSLKFLMTATLVPTIYFSLADAYAISDGIWTIHEATRSGWDFGGLPFEEAFFFFITSLLLAQGLVLWHSLREK